MNEMMNMLDMLKDMDGSADAILEGASQIVMGAAVVTIVIGLVIAIFGLKIVRVLAALIGLVLGAGIGIAAGVVAGLNGTAMIGVTAGGALILCILAAVLKKFGVFLVTFFYSMGTMSLLIRSTNLIVIIICLAVSIILAVLAVLFTDLIVILITGITGGTEAGMALPVLFGMSNTVWIGYALSAAFAVIGWMIQTMMHSRKVGKKEKIYSRKVRDQESMESEVEKARMVLDEDMEDSEDEDD